MGSMMANQRFEASFSVLIGHEGGYQRFRGDPGNWTGGRVGEGRLVGTKYGISAASYPDVEIELLDLERAKAIYLEDYWGPARCDELPAGLDLAHFDAAVNHGVRDAVRFVQQVVGVGTDGLWGPITRRAVARAVASRERNDLLVELVAERVFDWMLLDRLDDRFGRGWARRGCRLMLQASQ